MDTAKIAMEINSSGVVMSPVKILKGTAKGEEIGK